MLVLQLRGGGGAARTEEVALTGALFAQILKPAEKKKSFTYGGAGGAGRPVTPPRKNKGSKKAGQA